MTTVSADLDYQINFHACENVQHRIAGFNVKTGASGVPFVLSLRFPQDLWLSAVYQIGSNSEP